ncbi:unnamed protein product (mitochondrion) [Plasmodiophora brassicae]|uniref:Uncharacterized protein n=1 Tax=Plasmodiophora brassicae TaxID=37360 RepID=A0A0G4J1F7_PLABS|nr:hypothetical protein PBRA_001958 [Plasmodiophora brassicae]SPR01378.1 unnamed protein product [Plasmodiophora brassicae]
MVAAEKGGAVRADRWSKLLQFGVSAEHVAGYAAYCEMQTSTKLGRLLTSDMPTLEEFISMRESYANARCDMLLEQARRTPRRLSVDRVLLVDDDRRPPSVRSKLCRIMGVNGNDLKYYIRFGKAVQILGDAPTLSVQ